MDDEDEDVFNALQTRTVYLPGGLDRSGKIIFIVNIVNDQQLWNRNCLEISIDYLKRSLSRQLLKNGVSVIVDAQKCSSRITRAHSRVIYSLFSDTAVNLYLVRSEGFWEKHVEPCTKSQTKDEPLVLSKSRLTKYFDSQTLPLDLGGSLQFNYDLWLQQRKAIDAFRKALRQSINDMDNLHELLLRNRSSQNLRRSESDQELKTCTQLHAIVQTKIDEVIDMGKNILLQLMESYPLTDSKAHTDVLTAETVDFATTTRAVATKIPPLTTSTATAPTTPAGPSTSSVTITRLDNNHTTSGNQQQQLQQQQQQQQQCLPIDLSCERNRLELQLNDIERRQTVIRTAWLDLLQNIDETRELASLEDGVAFVTNWILTTAEQLLNRQQAIGYDVRTCEKLRHTHDALEMECRETYGFYAELLYKIDKFSGAKDGLIYKDLLSQRDFMQFVCRSFATRLERRRNILITSLRFYRLVSEYFDRTSGVFETLVMANRMEDFEGAADNLQRLKDSQTSLAKLESELTREGEKLSDMLAMPVKDALGRDLHLDYSDDIASVRDILETTGARCRIFTDSVELQKLTLEQVTHIYAYEKDARMAKQWMDDLYDVMIRCHSHVGCNIHEIQVQKDEVQSFQETGKSIYHYGSQLLQASQALRLSCRLDLEESQMLLLELERTWHSLLAISQEHMTRLRVSAVFHRSVEDYDNKLHELKSTVLSITHSGSSSSGVSSENDDDSPHSSPEMRMLENVVRDEFNSPAGIKKDGEKTATSTPAARLRRRQRKSRRRQLRKCLEEREKLLVEVGRMVRLGRLLKTRLKEPFILDVATGKSVMSDDLNHDVTSPSIDSGNGGSEIHTTTTTTTTTTATTTTGSTTSTTIESDLKSTAETSPNSTVTATTLIVTPTGNNVFACNAITNKLEEITEVAEALDAVIHDAQENLSMIESHSISPATKSTKSSNTANRTIIEDWHSRSTEDDSFVTASEGNFTPHSHSSSYHTASGHTSSFIGSDKDGSNDASEVDDYNFNTFEMHESMISQTPPPPPPRHGILANEPSTIRKMRKDKELEVQVEEACCLSYHNVYDDDDDDNDDDGSMATNSFRINVTNGDNIDDVDDRSNGAHIEELNSESDPSSTLEYRGNCDSVPIEVCEVDNEYLSSTTNSPTTKILTENTAVPASVTPEVRRACISTNAYASGQITNANKNNNTNNTNNKNKPNTPWRTRNKYYENVTKRTIKGLL